MRDELAVPIPLLYGFLLTLARVGGALVFVPLPGIRSGPESVRAVLAVGMTLALFSRWSAPPIANPGIGELAGWLLTEAAIGLAIGLAVSFITEGFLLAAQILSLQAGFSYASTVDPTTKADSTVLVVIAQLLAGLLFLATDLDRQVFLAFARSLETFPPGSALASPALADKLIPLGAGIFSTGLRLVLPVVILLVMVDIALALLGRLNAHLQLLTLAFPIKILAGLGLLAWILVLFPRVFNQSAEHTLAGLHILIAR